MNEVYFEGINKIIKKHLQQAETEIIVAVAWITDIEIINILEECLEKGISVKIIFYKDKINKIELFENLYNNGAIIRYTTSLMHNKFCVIDNLITINGSYNWTKSARTNDENIQVTFSSEIATNFVVEFDRIFRNSKVVDKYFANNEEAFLRYLTSIGKPTTYPVFYKQNINNRLKSNIFRRESICKSLEKLDYVYVCFYSEDDFIKFLKTIYQFLHTSKLNDKKISLESNLKKKPIENYDYKNSLIAIDIIKDDSILPSESITAGSYIDDKYRFSEEQFIHFSEIKKENIVIIGFFEESNKDLKDKLFFVTLKNSAEDNKVNKWEFDKIIIDDQFIIFCYTRNTDISQINSKRDVKFQYFVNKNNFELDYEVSSQFNINAKKEIADLIHKRNLEEKQREKQKRIDEYKNRSDCYLATMVYGDINHPNIIKLRSYRNETLLSNAAGRKFIKYYYIISPRLVIYLGNKNSINQIVKLLLEKIILKIIDKKNQIL